MTENSVLHLLLIGLAVGAAVGFTLEKSRIFEPGMIVGQIQLANFNVMRMSFSAVAIAALVIAFLAGLGFIGMPPMAGTYRANLAGGILLGIGVAFAGACPVTMLVQIAAGYRDALFTLAGGLCAVPVFLAVKPELAALFAETEARDARVTELVGIPFWIGALGLFTVLVLTLCALEARLSWENDLGPNVDGDFEMPPPAASKPRIVQAAE